MWKKGLLLMLGAVLALSLTACAGNGDGASSQAGTDSSHAGEAQTGKTLDVEAAAQALLDGADFDDELAEVSEKVVAGQYQGLDMSDVVSCKVYISGTASGDELSVFEAKDAEAAQRIKTVTETRLSSLIEQYSDYAPDKVPKLEDPVLVVEGNYVVLCVSNDNAKAQELLDAQWK